MLQDHGCRRTSGAAGPREPGLAFILDLQGMKAALPGEQKC